MMGHDEEVQSGGGLHAFDAATHLKDEETIRAYLQAALDDPTPGALWVALDSVAKARKRGLVLMPAR
ncbi:helix-turn-helix domain-containing transcriptional regulator [Pseudomonas veronii]|jgi:DNA-binding phage protein|uniref:helix-turn-helix domain-containing transcriptional regulator n=2 Tax=Pseudomonas TaxID=286 RepID=UPI0035E3E076